MVVSPAHHFSVRERLQGALIVVFLLLTVLVVLSQANPLLTRLGRDSGMYAYVASHLLRGMTPYVTAWEHKPPLIFFIDAAGLWLGHGSRWGIWAVEFLFLLGAAWAGFQALKKNFGLGPAILASLIWLSGVGLVLEGGNFTEEYSLLFSFVSLWLFTLILRRPESLWMHASLGLAFGCGFLTRPNNTGVQISIILTEILLVALKRRPLRQSLQGRLATGVGFLLPLIAVSLYFVARHAFQDFLDAGFIYNLSYGGQPDPIGALLSGIRNLGFAAGVALVGMWLAFQQLRSQIAHSAQLETRVVDPLILWLCLDFIIEVALSGLSGLNYPHYFICWLPWIAVASALVFSKLFPSFAQWSERFPVRVLLGAILLLWLVSFNTLMGYKQGFAQLVTDREAAQRKELLPQYVNEHTLPGETVLAWGGEAGINFLADRDSPTAHFQYGILVPSKITDRISAEFYQDIRSHPPALILDGSGGDQNGELAPLSTSNPVAWSAAHAMYAPPYLAEFFDFFHQNYVYKTSVAGVPIYYLNR
jgi:hypothetical protein